MKGPSDEQRWSSSHRTSKKELIELAGQQKGTDCKCQMELIICQNNILRNNESLHNLWTRFESFCLSAYAHSQTEPDITAGCFVDHVRTAFNKTSLFIQYTGITVHGTLNMWRIRIRVFRKIFFNEELVKHTEWTQSQHTSCFKSF